MDSDTDSDAPDVRHLCNNSTQNQAPIALTHNIVLSCVRGDEMLSEGVPTRSRVQQQPSRIVGCSFSQLQSELDKLADAGLNSHVYPLNITRFSGGAGATVQSIYENRNNCPGANFDARELKSKGARSWEPGHAEITSIAANAFELADLVCLNSKEAVVVCSTTGGDAVKTLVACTASALCTIDKKRAELAVRRRLPQPKDATLKRFVEAFSTFGRKRAVANTEAFYYKNF